MYLEQQSEISYRLFLLYVQVNPLISQLIGFYMRATLALNGLMTTKRLKLRWNIETKLK